MTISAHFYNHFFSHLAVAGINLTGDTLKLANVGTGYTPNQAADEFWSTPQASEISATGYTAGGATVGSIAVTPSGWSFDGVNASWAGGPFAGVRYSILYDSTPVGISSPTAGQMPLIGYIDWGTTVSLNGVNWNAAGIGQIVPA